MSNERRIARAPNERRRMRLLHAEFWPALGRHDFATCIRLLRYAPTEYRAALALTGFVSHMTHRRPHSSARIDTAAPVEVKSNRSLSAPADSADLRRLHADLNAAYLIGDGVAGARLYRSAPIEYRAALSLTYFVATMTHRKEPASPVGSPRSRVARPADTQTLSAEADVLELVLHVPTKLAAEARDEAWRTGVTLERLILRALAEYMARAVSRTDGPSAPTVDAAADAPLTDGEPSAADAPEQHPTRANVPREPDLTDLLVNHLHARSRAAVVRLAVDQLAKTEGVLVATPEESEQLVAKLCARFPVAARVVQGTRPTPATSKKAKGRPRTLTENLELARSKLSAETLAVVEAIGFLVRAATPVSDDELVDEFLEFPTQAQARLFPTETLAEILGDWQLWDDFQTWQINEGAPPVPSHVRARELARVELRCRIADGQADRSLAACINATPKKTAAVSPWRAHRDSASTRPGEVACRPARGRRLADHSNARPPCEGQLMLDADHGPGSEVAGSDAPEHAGIVLTTTVARELAERAATHAAASSCSTSELLAFVLRRHLAQRNGRPTKIRPRTSRAPHQKPIDRAQQHVATFLAECCDGFQPSDDVRAVEVVAGAPMYRVRLGRLFRAFHDWCQQRGSPAFTATMFGHAMSALKFERRRHQRAGAADWFYVGIALKGEPVDERPEHSAEASAAAAMVAEFLDQETTRHDPAGFDEARQLAAASGYRVRIRFPYTESARLFVAFKRWCTNTDRTMLTRSSFFRALSLLGAKTAHLGAGSVYVGVQLNGEPRATERDECRVSAFLAQKTSQGPYVKVGRLHAAFLQWCAESEQQPLTGTMFGRVMSALNFERARRESGPRIASVYLGIDLTDAPEKSRRERTAERRLDHTPTTTAQERRERATAVFEALAFVVRAAKPVTDDERIATFVGSPSVSRAAALPDELLSEVLCDWALRDRVQTWHVVDSQHPKPPWVHAHELAAFEARWRTDNGEAAPGLAGWEAVPTRRPRDGLCSWDRRLARQASAERRKRRTPRENRGRDG